MKYDFPRYVGNPFQSFVRTREEFVRFCQANSGRAPCFTSHNGHPSKDVVLNRYIPFDFDDTVKLENTLNDALAFRDWGRENDVPTRAIFTGRKGMHTYLVLKPSRITANDALRRLYKALQMRVIKEANLRTWDKRVVGDPRRMMRIPNTKHEKGLWCVEVPDSVLDLGDIELLKDYAQYPQRGPPHPESRETLSELCRRLGVRPGQAFDPGPGSSTFADHKGVEDDLVKMVLPRPCIQQAIMQRNPKHLVRFEACLTLVNALYPLSFIREFFDHVAQAAGWVDRHNREMMAYQIHDVYTKRRGYELHSCRKIRDEGLCLGPTCHLFKGAFPDG